MGEEIGVEQLDNWCHVLHLIFSASFDENKLSFNILVIHPSKSSKESTLNTIRTFTNLIMFQRILARYSTSRGLE